MELGVLLVLLLVLACPLLMVWMLRGGHGHGSHAASRGHMHAGAGETPGGGSVELRRRMSELEAEIARLEEDGTVETTTPAAG